MADNSANNPNYQQESVLTASVSDQAAESDSLGFEPYVTAIAEFLTNPVTQPPLTISIEGAWGSGKSSFMKQLLKEIEESEQKKFEKEFLTKINKFERDVRKKIFKVFSKIENNLPNWLTWSVDITRLILDQIITTTVKICKLLILNANRLKPKPRTVWFNAWRHDKAEALWAAFALEFLRKISKPRTFSDTIPTFIGHTKLFFFRFNFQSGLLDFIRMIAQLLIGFSAIAIIVIFSVFKGYSWVQQLSDTISNLNIRLEQTPKPQKQVNSASSRNSNNQQNSKNSSPPQNLSNQDSSNNTRQESPFNKPIGAAGIGASVLATISVWQQLRKLVGDPKKALTQYLKSPDYNNQVAFVEKFHEDFKKIVDAYAGTGKKVYVFIDDLDRCELPKAADLMQALNLMISNDPHIIFILGMDREKVAAGLAVKYKDILPYLPLSSIATDNENKNNRNSFLSGMEYGYSFLEKFIQIPFQVPQPANSDLDRFLEKIAIPVQPEKHSFFSQIIRTFRQVFTNPRLRLQLLRYPLPEQTQNPTGQTENTIGQPRKETNLQRRKNFKIAVTKIKDSQTIQKIVIMVAPALGNNPRRLKQFLNLFRLKTYIASNTGLFDELIDESDRISNQPLTLEQLGKFTAISVKWPQLLIDLETNQQLLTKLQKFALLQKFEPGEDDSLTQEWGSKQKLIELLRSGSENTESWDKLSLEKVDVDKLLQVSPGTQDDLSSDKGVDYTQLRDLLAAGNWKDADYETYRVMLQVVYREEDDWIRPEELLNFPCTDLRTIDRLWVKYSIGRFGFSVQKKIYLEVGGVPDGSCNEEAWVKFEEAWEKLGDRVGWRVKQSWISYTGVTFDTIAPRGHLPVVTITVSGPTNAFHSFHSSLLSHRDL